MKKVSIVLTLSLLLPALFLFAEDPIDSSLRHLVAGFAPPSGRLVVSVGNFTYGDKDLASPFSRFFAEKLSTALAAHQSFEVFAREKLDELLKTAELSMSEVFDQDTVVQVGRMKGVKGIFSGRFFDLGESVGVTVELVDVETGTIKKKEEIRIPKAQVPASVAILPDNYGNALAILEELSSVGKGADSALAIRAWTDRGNGGTYRDGEELVVRFFANRDCYLKLYHIDVKGNATLIFPNKYYKGNVVKARTIYRIPDAFYPFTFQLGAPYGAEFIKAVASTTRFTDVEEAFQDLGTATRGLVTRGLNVKAKDTLTAEALINYTILK
jgi:TolB-like protein